MRYFALAIVVVLINIVFPSGWFNLAYVVTIFLLLMRPVSKSLLITVPLLLVSDLLNLRTLGFSVFVVFLVVLIAKGIYKRFLPHKPWVLVLVGLGSTVAVVYVGQWLSPFLL